MEGYVFEGADGIQMVIRYSQKGVRSEMHTHDYKKNLGLSPVDNVREDTEKAWKNTHVFIDTWKKHRAESY